MATPRRTFFALLGAWCSTAARGWPRPPDSPRPENAVTAIIEAFQKYPLVGLGELHRVQQEHDFILSLLSDRRFQRSVNDIVVEFGNARYQPVLDRYISGQQVSLNQLRQVWRDTVNILVWDSPVYERFFVAVRELNQALPKDSRLRVLAGDPPIDWPRIHKREQWEAIARERDVHAANVVEREVLKKRRRALLIFGAGHLLRKSQWFTRRPDPRGNLAETIEKRHRGKILLISPQERSFSSNEREARLSSWPVPSLALVAETWLADLQTGGGESAPRLKELADALLYLGPSESLTVVGPAAELYRDATYLKELLRRDAIQGGLNRGELDELRKQFLN